MLKKDPYRIFARSLSPVGLYARQKWLGEGNEAAWKNDFDRGVTRLLSGQSDDGSWNQSVKTTIQRLFGLHLTVRNPTQPIDKALGWLMALAFKEYSPIRKDISQRITSRDLENLPFTPGCFGYFLLGATLFLASIFGREDDTRVQEAYARLNQEGIKKKGRWCGWSCNNNVLRAFVVHPRYSESRATELAVHALSRVQDDSGKWPRVVPFYQTVNALAHLDSPTARRQVAKAFRHLLRTQNPDGTWGRSRKEWNTFLVVHALRRKRLL